MGCTCTKTPTPKHQKTTQHRFEERSVKSSQTVGVQVQQEISPRIVQQSIHSLPPPTKKHFPLADYSIPPFVFYEFGSLQGKLKSNWNDWQYLLKENCKYHHINLYLAISTVDTQNLCVKKVWEKMQNVELAAKILSLSPRDWVKQTLILMHNIRLPGNQRAGVTLSRKLLQMNQHFRWFVWAVGSYFHVSMGDKHKEIGRQFKSMSGIEDLSLPKRLKQWLVGFKFKNVRFKLIYRESEQGALFKAESKALKLFSLSTEQVQKEEVLMPPMVVYVKIGQFLLYGAPIYSQELVTSSNKLSLDLFGKVTKIPQENCYELSLQDFKTPYFLVINLVQLLKTKESPRYICLVKSGYRTIRVMDCDRKSESISESKIKKMIYNSEIPNKVKIKFTSLQKYGWEFCIYYDKNSSGKRNKFIYMLGKSIRGTVVISLAYCGLLYPRFPVAHLKFQYQRTVKFHSIKACVDALEKSEFRMNSKSIKQLLHRKGLNSRYIWLVSAQSDSKRVQNILDADILAQAAKKLINSYTGEYKITKFDQFQQLVVDVVSPLIHPQQEFRSKPKQVTTVLFLNRLKIIKQAKTFKKKFSKHQENFKFLLSDEFITRIVLSATFVPPVFLQALEFHIGFRFTEQLRNEAQNDCFFFLYRQPNFLVNDIENLEVTVHSNVNFRQDAHFTFLKFLEQTSPDRSNSIGILGDSIAQTNADLLNMLQDTKQLQMILPGDLYSIAGSSLFRQHYEMPSLPLLQEWANCIDTLTRELITVDGQQTVLIQIFVHVLTQKYFMDPDHQRCQQILQRIHSIINRAPKIPSELIIAYQLWSALIQQQESLAQAEQSYISTLLLLTKLLGDPRGRGNSGVPWQLISAWKLGIIARQERRFLDAEAADQHFDAVGSKLNQLIPFIHWSEHQSAPGSLDPQSRDHFCQWMVGNCMTMYQSGYTWNNLLSKVYIKNTVVHQISSYASMSMNSGISTPASSLRDNRRAMQQSSLTQVLLPENGAINMNSTKGVLYLWGSDSDGELGLGTNKDILLPYPRLMTPLKDLVVKKIAAGAKHCIAITLQGVCFAWGNNQDSQLGLGTDAPKIVKTPTQIEGIQNIAEATCGYLHSILLSEKGLLYSMGLGQGGVLGHGDLQNQDTPKLIKSMKRIQITKIQSGAYHNLAIDKQRYIYSWGRGDGGQLGFQVYDLIQWMKDLQIESSQPYIHTPVRLQGEFQNLEVLQIACGEAHSLALTDEFSVYGWGWGSNGQLGNGVQHDLFQEAGHLSSIQYKPVHIKFPQNQKIKTISAGGLFSVFISKSNEVFACGMNDFGQLGIQNANRDHTDVSEPTRLDCFSGYPIHEIYCGENHTIAVSAEYQKSTWAWGRSKEGQLGLGDTSFSQTPRPVQLLNNCPVSTIQCGRMFSFAVTKIPKMSVNKTQSKAEMKWGCAYYKKFSL